MKKPISIIVMIVLVVSCNNSGYKKITEYHDLLDTLDINDYNSLSAYKRQISEIRPTKESYCLLDSFKAEIDIKKNKLTYFIGHERELLDPSLTELPNYLKKNFAINSIELLVGCIVTNDDKYYECYERLMHKAIAEKYGNEFIEKSKRIVDSIYLHKNKDIIYTRRNSYGMYKRHKSTAYNSWKDSVQNVIEKIKYSKISKSKIDKETNISAQFIITKSGKIDSLELYSFYSDNKNEPYLKKQLKDFILRTKWQPVELYGLKLHTKENIFM